MMIKMFATLLLYVTLTFPLLTCIDAFQCLSGVDFASKEMRKPTGNITLYMLCDVDLLVGMTPSVTEMEIRNKDYLFPGSNFMEFNFASGDYAPGKAAGIWSNASMSSFNYTVPGVARVWFVRSSELLDIPNTFPPLRLYPWVQFTILPLYNITRNTNFSISLPAEPFHLYNDHNVKIKSQSRWGINVRFYEWQKKGILPPDDHKTYWGHITPRAPLVMVPLTQDVQTPSQICTTPVPIQCRPEVQFATKQLGKPTGNITLSISCNTDLLVGMMPSATEIRNNEISFTFPAYDFKPTKPFIWSNASMSSIIYTVPGVATVRFTRGSERHSVLNTNGSPELYSSVRFLITPLYNVSVGTTFTIPLPASPFELYNDFKYNLTSDMTNTFIVTTSFYEWQKPVVDRSNNIFMFMYNNVESAPSIPITEPTVVDNQPQPQP